MRDPAMDARTYTAETAPEERSEQDRQEEECEAETTRVFRKTWPQLQRRLSLLAQANGNTARTKIGRAHV